MSLRDAVYGFAVGDALGVPYEFKQRNSFQCKDMTGYGTYNQPPGTWSDDTSMMLATCDSIKQCGGINIKDLRLRFEKWMQCGEYTAHGKLFDIGNTTLAALTAGKGINDINANGNGSLMRILPLAFIDCVDEEIFEVSDITHAHEISEESCLLYVAIAKRLICGENIKSILDSFKNCTFIRLTSIANLPKSEIKSTGYVVDTLEAALWCVETSYNYAETVLTAVNLGGDTDTIAGLSGGLAGIIYGFNGIPTEWIDKLANKELIERCLF